MNSRPLGRSLQPLAGESLDGFLLRLSYRLHLSPIRLARLAGVVGSATTVISRRVLLDLDIGGFAAFARLTEPEAAALTLGPWAKRYPPIARSLRVAGRRPQLDNWLFNPTIRYCPRCLAGDSGTVRDELGGCWKLFWQLPIAFACLEHAIPLQHACPQAHPVLHDHMPLISQASDSTLHPVQCRQPQPGSTSCGRKRPSCAQQFCESHDAAVIAPEALELQRQLIGMLGLDQPATDAAALFSDLRVITTMLRVSWPDSRNLIEPSMQMLVSEHIDELDTGIRRALDRPPGHPLASAGLLTAASAILDDPERQNVLAQHLRGSWDGRPSDSPWTHVFNRHKNSCSRRLRQAFEPIAHSFRRIGGPHSAKAPIRAGGYSPEHIPAFLEQPWFDEHLAPLDCRSAASTARRFAAATLVQWTAGGSVGDAAHYLGINPRAGQYAPTSDLTRWLTALGPDRFTRALRDIARRLDTANGLIDYHRRRAALQHWSLASDEWDEIVCRLPPVPGPFQPVLDDRKRQEASAFIWARITQGEHRFAPRPIEAAQPAPVRRQWQQRRGATAFQLSRPEPIRHYAALQRQLIRHAEEVAATIDMPTQR